MRTLEKIIIKTLEKYAIDATTKENLTEYGLMMKKYVLWSSSI